MQERRKQPRKDLMSYSQVYDLQDGKLIGYLGDLNLFGAMVISDHPVDEGIKLMISIELPELPKVNELSMNLSARIAWTITSVTASGWETMTTCEPATSVIMAPARCAIERVRSAPAARSPVATTAHDGRSFQAGAVAGSENAASATGRCVAAMTAAVLGGKSPAKASRNFAGSTTNSAARAPVSVA